MQFLARVGFLVLILPQQGVSLQQHGFVVEATGNLGADAAQWLSRRRRTSVGDAPQWSGQVDFGGTKHGQMTPTRKQQWKRQPGDSMRPELVKTQACDDDSKCDECTAEAACWQGSRSYLRDGKLELVVPANSTHNRFNAEVWASCAGGGGEWRLHIWHGGLQNGDLNVYFNETLIRTVSEGRKRQAKFVEIPIEKDSRVRVEFVVKDKTKKAFGLITLFATGVDQYVDECMGVKYCLAQLADGSEDGRVLLNSNTKQLRCLIARTEDERRNISGHCYKWDLCLSKDTLRKQRLVTILKVGLGTRASLSESVGNADEDEGHKSCIDPVHEDAESWDCECLKWLSSKCDGDEECLRKRFCKSGKVCESWKGDNCGSSLMAKQNASAQARREAGGDSIADGLDSALDGKCKG